MPVSRISTTVLCTSFATPTTVLTQGLTVSLSQALTTEGVKDKPTPLGVMTGGSVYRGNPGSGQN